MTTRSLTPLLFIGLVAASAAAIELKLDRPDRIVFKYLFGDVLAVAWDDAAVRLYRAGRLYGDLGIVDGLVGFDRADVDGDGTADLVVIAKSTVYRLAGTAGALKLEALMPNRTAAGQFDVANVPRRYQLFYPVPGAAKAAALWFGADGLYTAKPGAAGEAVLLAPERLEAYFNLVGAQLSMPGMDTLSLGLPRLGVAAWGAPGEAAAYYIAGGKLKIVPLSGAAPVAVDLAGYFSDYPGVIWDTVPAGFADVTGDGLADLILFSIEPDAANFGVAMQIAVKEFPRVAGIRTGNPFSPTPSRSYTLDQMNLANGVCFLSAPQTGRPPTLVFKTVNLTAALSDLVLKRNFSFECRSYAFDKAAGRYAKSKYTIPYSLTIDPPNPATLSKTRTITEMLSGVDFINLLDGLFTEVPPGAGGAAAVEVVTYDGKKREFAFYDPAAGPKGARIKAPAFLRLTDDPYLDFDAAGFGVTLVRNGTLYYERVAR
jgi:hypothetical protein